MTEELDEAQVTTQEQNGQAAEETKEKIQDEQVDEPTIEEPKADEKLNDKNELMNDPPETSLID